MQLRAHTTNGLGRDLWVVCYLYLLVTNLETMNQNQRSIYKKKTRGLQIKPKLINLQTKTQVTNNSISEHISTKH